jgi:DNA polymerase
MINFDFETRSRADLRKVGAYKYAEDLSTDVICFAYSIDGGPVTGVMGGFLPDDLRTAILRGDTFHAWNATFEYLIWNKVCVPRYGWPMLKAEQLRDTMAQAAMMNLPQALGDCVKALRLGEKFEKSKRGEHLITLLSKPITAGHKKGEFREDDDLRQEMLDYCKQDVVAESAAMSVLEPLIPEEQSAWLATLRINDYGLPVALDEIDNIIAIVEREKEHLNGELYNLTNVTSASQRDKVLAVLHATGLEITDLTGDVIKQVLAEDLTPFQRRVLEIRDAVSQTSTAKFAKMKELACADGRIHGLLTYHGASTGRDASRGLNAQNLARPPLKRVDLALDTMTAYDWEDARMIWGDKTMGAAVSSIRGVIKAPEGRTFIDADFSSVENRTASWIAGQQDKLDAFAAGMDEYKLFATEMYGVAYSDVTKDMRQIAKSAVLGGMFGQGWKGLIDYAAPLGVVLDEEKARHLIDMYRAQYPHVQKTWYACGDAMLDACQTPGVIFPVGKRIAFKVEKNFLRLRLPSGRVLYWYEPRVEPTKTPWGAIKDAVVTWGVNSITRKWERKALIGSSAFQSSVQGCARDVLINGCKNLAAAGYPIVLRVHDEVLAEVPEGTDEETKFGNLLCQAPAWADGLPLAYEAWTSRRFRK